MSIDERLVFLLRAESLHASSQEIHAAVAELRATAFEHTKQLEIDVDNIRRLANIAAAHEQRLDDLEGNKA